jgi:hypothetical protein
MDHGGILPNCFCYCAAFLRICVRSIMLIAPLQIKHKASLARITEATSGRGIAHELAGGIQ